MCEFISAVLKDGKYYVLTDAEVFSEIGREKLSGCKDNDFLGHGAIRKFYGITDGQDVEYIEFWKKSLPKELKEYIKEFDKHFHVMWQKCFQNEDLRYIVCNASDKNWRNKASEQLLNQNPLNDDLRYIVCYASDKNLKNKAYEQLLNHNPTNYDLQYIVCYAPEKYKTIAWEQLLKHQTNDELWYIGCYSTWKYKALAKEMLKQRGVNNDKKV